MVTGLVMTGRAVEGFMVWTPVPGMANFMTSASVVALASSMARLREPTPESLVLVTRKVLDAAWAGGATRPAAREGSTKLAATSAVARATLILRFAEFLDRRAFDVAAAVYVISCLLLFGRPVGGSPVYLVCPTP